MTLAGGEGYQLQKFGVKTRLKKPFDAYWDFRLGVNTFGYAPAVGKPTDPDFQVHYMPTPYRKIFRILDRLAVTGEDVFTDLGCGLGRVVFCASHRGARKAIGVDINESLIAGALASRSKSRFSSDAVDFRCQPAQETDFDEVTLLYMFHPFGAGTMTEVMEALAASLKRAPRRFRLAYENPVNAGVVDGVDALTRFDDWEAAAGHGSNYAVSFWRTDPS